MKEQPKINFDEIFPDDGDGEADALYTLFTDDSPASQEAKKLLTDAGVIFDEVFVEECDREDRILPSLSIRRRSMRGIDFIRWYTKIHREDATPPPPPILYTNTDEDEEAKKILMEAGIEFVEHYHSFMHEWPILCAAEGTFHFIGGIRKYIRYMEAIGKIPTRSHTK